MLDLSTLNPPQREAVQTVEGPLLVLAGAGSGKTRVIVHRIAHMLEQGIAPSSVLAVTFTNKAATEMRARVGALVGPRAAKGLTVSTFHAFGCELLRSHIEHLGYPRRFAIADAGDQVAIVKRAMREMTFDDESVDLRRLLMMLSRKRCGDPERKVRAAASPGDESEALCDAEVDKYEAALDALLPAYERSLRVQGCVDFDDLILLPLRLIAEHAEVREKLRARYRYLLVDEYQDTNRSQLQLLIGLAGDRRNVCAVGDDDQSIYSWRGAEVQNILSFDRHFPGAKEVRLEQNYRSTGAILQAANAVIAGNLERKPKRLWTAQGEGEKLRVMVLGDEEEEARAIAREIGELLSSGWRGSDIAVLYRTNLQARPLEEALREARVDYQMIGGQEFFDKSEIKDLVAYLKALHNPRDEVSLRRIINVPARGIGDTTLERVGEWAKERSLSTEAALRRAGEIETLAHGAAARIGDFVALLDKFRALLERRPVDEVIRDLVESTGLREAARLSVKSAAAGARKAAALDAFLDSIASFASRNPARAKLSTLLQRFALDTRDEDSGEEASSVTLMTLHAAKGLEWPVVFLCGLEEGLMPHGGMQGEAQNLAEERRLAYVGITRARERLFLSRAAERVQRGKRIPRTPSRFLEEIPEGVRSLYDGTAVVQVGKSFFADLRARLKANEAAKASGGG